MLSPEQLSLIPRTTKNEWKEFKHFNYYGYEIAKDYIADLDYIKDVLTNRHLRYGMRFMCTLSYAYRDVISTIENNRKLLRENAEKITHSIRRLSKLGKIKIADACAIYGVSRDWFYRHRAKRVCNSSKIKRCFRQYPNQLTIAEVQKIENIIHDNQNIGKTKTTLYYDSMRRGLITVGKSTFFRYANLLGYKKSSAKKLNKKYKGYLASRPFECIHVDVTHVHTTTDGIQYVAFIKDNFSRALLHVKSTSCYPNSSFIRDTIEETFSKFNLLNQNGSINIISDGGPENKGSLIEWVNQITTPPLVKKIIANTPDFPFSNSMSESTHSIYKTEFLKRKHSYDQSQHLRDIEHFMEYYNFTRYPSNHYGLSVMEVLNGKIPNKNLFKDVIQQGKSKRISFNKAFNQCSIKCY